MPLEVLLLSASVVVLMLLVALEGSACYQRRWMSRHLKMSMNDHAEWLVDGLSSRLVDCRKEISDLGQKVDRLESLLKEQNSHVFVASPWDKNTEKVND